MSPGPPTPPIGNITLEVTHRCHRRCTFCYLPRLATPHARTCDELAAHGADLSVLTDGAQLDESRAKQLVASGVRAIQPTLLAARPDVHDELRGTGAFAMSHAPSPRPPPPVSR